MAKTRKRPVTWIEVAVSNAGLRKGPKALVWAYQWAVVREKHGREPTVDEVAHWWNMNRRTAFRDQGAFREAFPMLDTPAQIYASPEVREALKTFADLGDRLDEAGAKPRESKIDLNAIRIGALPANL